MNRDPSADLPMAEPEVSSDLQGSNAWGSIGPCTPTRVPTVSSQGALKVVPPDETHEGAPEVCHKVPIEALIPSFG